MSVERKSRQGSSLDSNVVFLTGFGAILFGSSLALFDSMAISPSQQIKAEHPSPITEEQHNAFKRYVLEYQGQVVRLADEGRYGEIPALAEAPEIRLARQQLSDYEHTLALRGERREQIIADEFVGPSLITRGRVYLAVITGGALAILSVTTLALWDRLRRNNASQITPTGSI